MKFLIIQELPIKILCVFINLENQGEKKQLKSENLWKNGHCSALFIQEFKDYTTVYKMNKEFI